MALQRQCYLQLASLILGSLLLMAGNPSIGHAQADSHAEHDHSHANETLAFNLSKWKEMHFDDAEKATKHFETVKKLGCEVKQANHAGHIDVVYRCPEWKVLAVSDHAMADQWAAWLKNAGFDVSHGHTDVAFATGPEVVELRMVKWKTIHGNGSAEEAETLEQLKKLGVEVIVESHGNHDDIRFRASDLAKHPRRRSRDGRTMDEVATSKWFRSSSRTLI